MTPPIDTAALRQWADVMYPPTEPEWKQMLADIEAAADRLDELEGETA